MSDNVEVSFDDELELEPEVVVTETTETKSEDAKAEGKETDPLAFLDEKAPEDNVLTQLEALGINPQNAPAVSGKAQAFDVMTQLIENNPRLLLDEIEKKFPDSYSKLVDEASQRFVSMYDKPGEGKDDKVQANTAIDKQVQALQDQINALTASKQAESQKLAINAIETGFNTKVDTLLSNPAFESLKPNDKRGIKLVVKESLGADQQAMGRVLQGNFQDVARHLKAAVTDWTKDTVKASTEEVEARTRVKTTGVAKVVPGAHPTAGEEQGSGDKDWDKTADSFASSLLKSFKRK